MNIRPHYRTIVLSDIHLGTTHSKVNQVSDFLSSVDCDRLILNGDIIDGWSLQKSGIKKWKAEHTRFFKILMKMMENCGTQIIYVRGNHDDFLDNLIPLQFINLSLVKDYTLESNGRYYFVTHGDVLEINSMYNKYRTKRGKTYFSLSQAIKQKVKKAVSYISDFEHVLVDFARSRKCDGVICGHIHHPENRMINGIHYLNSGDWVETLSALTENNDGEWNVIYYNEIADKLNKDNNVLSLISAAS